MSSKTQTALPALAGRVDDFTKTYPEAPGKLGHAKELVAKAIESGAMELHLDQGFLHLGKAWEVDYGAAAVRSGNGMDIFTAPLTGGTPTSCGALTVAIQDGNISGYREMHLKEKTAESGTVQTWLNGKPDLDREVSQKEIAPHPQTGVATPKDILSGDWWYSFNSCLSAQGVAAWAIVGIEAAVGLACAASDGLGCVLAAAVGPAVGGTVVTYCGGWASDHEGQSFS